MSSDGSETLSTLSKIRQFGLYRTVDARTEEFLKLSRKKQLKQGFVCAAISTAVTVTVVIVSYNMMILFMLKLFKMLLTHIIKKHEQMELMIYLHI